jgi:uncharacterized protein YdaT
MAQDGIARKRALIQALPEPMRSTALTQLCRMLEEGRDEDEALDVALAEAEEWKTSRAPAVSDRPGETRR